MTFNYYQQLASRTIRKNFTKIEQRDHALHGMVGELGELHSLYQKEYQGHGFDEQHAKKEVGDLLWFIAEYCTAMGWHFNDVAGMNIDKLVKRYPDGFNSEKSLHRADGDL